MESNPYAPPKAAVADVEPAIAGAPAFFAVSRTKLVVMSTMTLTLYQLYWFYKNWACVRARGARVMPLVRTILAVFFCYDLFDRIRGYRNDLPSARLPAGLLAAGWILVTILSGVLDRFGIGAGTPGYVYLITLLVGYSSVLFLIPVQAAANEISRAERPDQDTNGRFTVWNALWMILGGAITVVGLSATFFPAQ